MDVSKALKPLGIPVIADGGIRFTGDIVKGSGGRSKLGNDGLNVCRTGGISGRNYYF